MRHSARLRPVAGDPATSGLAANASLFDHRVGVDEHGLLGQPRFAKTLDIELRV
jgi:hypothetical protein